MIVIKIWHKFKYCATKLIRISSLAEESDQFIKAGKSFSQGRPPNGLSSINQMINQFLTEEKGQTPKQQRQQQQQRWYFLLIWTQSLFAAKTSIEIDKHNEIADTLESDSSNTNKNNHHDHHLLIITQHRVSLSEAGPIFTLDSFAHSHNGEGGGVMNKVCRSVRESILLTKLSLKINKFV